MCTLAVWRRVSARMPLVVAANRDELYARPAVGPRRLAEIPEAVAGRDVEAGGTWLGCRVEGPPLVAGVLNRRSVDVTAIPAAKELSRGQLCLDALRYESVEEALARVHAAQLDRYGSFNLMLADLERAVVVDNFEGEHVTELGLGLSVLTNLEVNDPRCPRLATAVRAFESVSVRIAAEAPVGEIVEACRSVLAGHENSLDPADASPFSRVCVHTELYGTRSSSVIVVSQHGAVRYFHAAGAPCREPFDEIDVAAS
jgi:uncharacterized protein with NRDE domain